MINKKSRKGRGSGKRKLKDPEAPKRPLSSYLEFCKDARPLLLASDHNLTVTEVGKELGKQWRELPSERKEFSSLNGNFNFYV